MAEMVRAGARMTRRRKLRDVFERATSFAALRSAALRAAAGLRERPNVARWLSDLEFNTLALQRALHQDAYQPGPLRTFRIRDPKPRTIAVAPFSDRVVHHALCETMLPMLESFADPDSFACRRGKGTLAALMRVKALCRRHPWCLRLDVRHFFETVRHDVLLALLERRVADPRALALVTKLLAAGVGPVGVGLPIGNLTSQHFGNFVLGHLDHFARERLRVAGWVRYMDDICVFGDAKESMWSILDALDSYLRESLQLQWKDAATQVLPVEVGVPFLGFRVWGDAVRLDAARRRRLRHRLRRVARQAKRVGEPDIRRAAGVASVFAWAKWAETKRWRQQWVALHGC